MSPSAMRNLEIISDSGACLRASTLCGNEIKDKATFPFPFSVRISVAIDTIL